MSRSAAPSRVTIRPKVDSRPRVGPCPHKARLSAGSDADVGVRTRVVPHPHGHLRDVIGVRVGRFGASPSPDEVPRNLRPNQGSACSRAHRKFSSSRC